jgi:hypothetical protein
MQSRRYHAWPTTRPQSTIGTASADLMMSRVLACKTAQPQDEYTAATDSLFAVIESSFPSEVNTYLPRARRTPIPQLAR